MNSLTVLYDAQCDLCRSIRSWLIQQPTYVELVFLAAGSDGARVRFPNLNHHQTLIDLTVVADNGNVYIGPKAWLMCLWALREYRPWALELSTPELMPIARRFIVWISQHRLEIAKFSKRMKFG